MISQIGTQSQWAWTADFSPGQSNPNPQRISLRRLLSCWTSIFRAAVQAKSRFDFSAEQNSTLDLPPLKALVAQVVAMVTIKQVVVVVAALQDADPL